MISAGFATNLTNAAGLGDFDPAEVTAMENTVHRLKTGFINSTVNAIVSTSINGGDIGDNLTEGWTSAMIMAGLAGVQHKIGDFGDANGLPDGTLPKMLAHAVAGGLASEAAGGSFADGAMAAALAEVTGPLVGESGLDPDRQVELQRLIGTTAVLIASGGDAAGASIAANVAASAHENNYLSHDQRKRVEELIDKLVFCQASQDCSSAELDEIFAERQLLQAQSTQQTLAMLKACKDGPSSACATHVEASAGFEEWAWGSAYNENYQARVNGLTPSMFQAGTAGGGFDIESSLNLDLFALELARGIQSGALDSDVADEQLLMKLQRMDGAMKVLAGAGQSLTAGGCLLTKLTCLLGLLNAGVAVDRLYEGTVTLISGENQLSAIEVGLVATGYSAEQAEAMRDQIETGVAIVTVGAGGTYLVYKGGVAVARLRNVEEMPLGTIGAPNRGTLPDRYDLDAEIDGIRNLGDPNAGVVNTDRVRPVNGRVPINSQQYAGTTFELSGDLGQRYPHGVPFSGAGYPDFSRYSQANVRIELTGSRSADFAAANSAAGLDRTPAGMTWHHHQDAGYMQLVPTDLHTTVRHTGGVATGRQ